jgi:hypothetical protein
MSAVLRLAIMQGTRCECRKGSVVKSIHPSTHLARLSFILSPIPNGRDSHSHSWAGPLSNYEFEMSVRLLMGTRLTQVSCPPSPGPFALSFPVVCLSPPLTRTKSE